MPEEGVAYNQKVIEWIAKAQKKFDEYNPENFSQKVKAIKAKHRGAQNEHSRRKQNAKDFFDSN